ncbi:MAG: c-type cytochrome domain-containing protein [Kofleriaceae bacterium]
MKAIVIVIVVTGCLDALGPDVGPLQMPDDDTCATDTDPGNQISFSQQVSPLLEDRCVRCHQPGGEGNRDSGLDLTSYDAVRAGGTRSVGTIVIPNDPCGSILFQKIGDAPPFGARMPRNAQPLARADQDLIHDWITEGALDN